MMSELPHFELFTDGACLGNPGPGGWAYILRDASGAEIEHSGGESASTNQRMEVAAVLAALQSLEQPSRIHLFSDSKYVTDGLTVWLENWIAKGWRTAGRKPVKNQDLWKPLAEQRERHEIATTWVEGHTGHPENERCDQLAFAAAEAVKESGP